MAGSRLSGVDPRRRRRWTFADCIFDEANWALFVDGKRVAVEAKPLELLRQLLLRSGELVSKEELLDAIWPDVMVVEASLPTAVRKLRCALSDDERDTHIIETVPRIGYRLGVDVQVEHLPAATPLAAALIADAVENPSPGVSASARGRRTTMGLTTLLSVSGLAITFVALALAVVPFRRASEARPTPSFTQREALNALRKLDVGAIENLLAAGWDPNTPFDDQGNGAVNMVLNICEWDRRHDQSQLLLVVRTLIDGGARLDHRNVWGDTAYSIAKAQRYCGPNHPVTNSIRTMCYAGYKPTGDRCLATYELSPKPG